MAFEFTAKTGRKVLAMMPELTADEARQMLDKVLTAHGDKPQLSITITTKEQEEAK